MTYPQPNADAYAVNGYQYFRLNTLLSSPGDIYESAQGGLAMALGPESDISKVNIAYFDDQVPTFMNQTSIGPTRSFVGRVDARNDARYMPVNRPGRILLWSDDLYDPMFRPPGFNITTDLINFITPRLDVIEYFSQQPGLIPARNDKSYFFQDVLTGGPATADTYIMIPYWGRRYAMIEATNKAVGPWSFGIFGVNFSISVNSTGYHQITQILATAPLIAGAQSLTKVTSFANGMFDMLMLHFHKDAPGLDPVMGPIKVDVSDIAQD